MSEPKTKAFCRDYDRLKDAIDNEERLVNEIDRPESGGGGGDLGEPPITSQPWGMAGGPPGVFFAGWIVNYHVGLDHFIGLAASPSEVSAYGSGIDSVAPVFSLSYSEEPEDREAESDLNNTVLNREWLIALGQGAAMFDALALCQTWIEHAQSVVIDGVDNEAVAAQILAARAAVRELRSAFDESIRKWREH